MQDINFNMRTNYRRKPLKFYNMIKQRYTEIKKPLKPKNKVFWTTI